MKNRLQSIFHGRKTLYLVLCIAVVSVFTLSIAYAAMSTVLEIHGNSEIVASSWNIYFDNPVVKEGSAYGELPIPDIGFDKDVVYFSVELDKPGDFYEFSVDVVNDGTIDAMIDSVVITPELTSEQAKYIKYEITYQNGESINTKQTLKKGTATPIKVRIEYRKDISASDLPTTSTKLDFRMLFVYVQSDGTGSEIPNNGMKVVDVVSGDGTNVGDEVCIKEECFYVISSDDSTVTMLAKYNLYVGNYFDETGNEYDPFVYTPIVYSKVKQSSDAIGYMVKDGKEVFPRVGVVIYNGGIALGYVNDYNNYLITQGVVPIESRLISYDEIYNLGCYYYVSGEYDEVFTSCEDAPTWVMSTSYWIGTPDDEEVIYVMFGNDGIAKIGIDNDDSFGVRPVITISRDYL